MTWWEWPSNFSGGQNVGGIGSFFTYANYAIEGWLGLIILFAIWTITFIVSKGQSSTKAFTVSTFVTFILSIFLMRIGLLSYTFVIILAVALAASVIALRYDNERGMI